MNNRDRNKKVNPGAIVAIAVALLAAEPEFFGAILGFAILLAIIASPFLILYFARKKKSGSAPAEKRKKVFDDCPGTFCFHKDRGEHHLRKDKEIDPWDRPDIDISKYQRRS